MEIMRRNIIVAITLLTAIIGGIAQVHAASRLFDKNQPLAVAIKITSAKTRNVPMSYMRKITKDEADKTIEVLDVSIEVSAKDIAAFPPSLQPRLYIGRTSYPIQRVEYSNWDARKEQTLNKKLPVGERQVFHFFITDWKTMEPGQPMILSILTPTELNELTNGKYTTREFSRVLPELKKSIPRYVPQDFLRLGGRKE